MPLRWPDALRTGGRGRDRLLPQVSLEDKSGQCADDNDDGQYGP